MPVLAYSETRRVEGLRSSVAYFEALGLDWGAAVIATAQRHGVRLMDVIVVAPRVDEGSMVRS
jgi:hypothetical protein